MAMSPEDLAAFNAQRKKIKLVPLQAEGEAQDEVQEQQDELQMVLTVQPEPTRGQIVRYVTSDNQVRHADILTVLGDGVELLVQDTPSFRAAPVSYDADRNPGTWHYAEVNR